MKRPTNSSAKVILVEFNEITWRLLEPLLNRGLLPTFAEFVRRGVRGTAVAVEDPPNLEPWVCWTTVYTGRPPEEHGVKFLEQPPETVTGPRVFDVAADAGRTVGVYGSIMTWPPRRDVRGFWVPSTFSPDEQTFPPELEPIQRLNLSATRAHNPTAAGRSGGGMGLAMQLRRLGLRAATAARVGVFLAKVRLRPHRYWEKVSLQPLVNLDFFERLYHRYRPDLASFHSNHVAHYQHRFWRAAYPQAFDTQTSAEDRARYGSSIEYGYQIADETLKRIWKLADDDTVVVVASGLGQQPQITEQYKGDKPIIRVKDINQLISLFGVEGQCAPLAMMAPQWILRIPDDTVRARVERVLDTAWYREQGRKLFSQITVGNSINFNFFQNNIVPLDLDATCGFPELGGREFRLRELCLVSDPTPKAGMHDKAGVLLMRGKGVRAGGTLAACTNLDIAPTILHLMGLPVPEFMKGRVLDEALVAPAASKPRGESSIVAVSAT
jgi:hypothetical protein